MACGVPGVATNIGGLPGLGLDDETGLLFGLGDLDGFVAKTRRLLTDEALHGRMAAASLERAHSQFNRDAIVSQYEDYYTYVLEKERVLH